MIGIGNLNGQDRELIQHHLGELDRQLAEIEIYADSSIDPVANDAYDLRQIVDRFKLSLTQWYFTVGEDVELLTNSHQWAEMNDFGAPEDELRGVITKLNSDLSATVRFSWGISARGIDADYEAEVDVEFVDLDRVSA